MYKSLVLVVCLLFLNGFLFSQNEAVKIHSLIPKNILAGETIKLKVKVSHTLSKEKTGQLTLSFYSAANQKSVDGWFLNFFPFQYFTSIKNTPFETEFPFTVPALYKGKFIIELVAKIDGIKDSVRYTVSTYHKPTTWNKK